MTEKRFTITQDFEENHRQIRDNGKIIMGCFLEPQAEPIVKLLNELHEERNYFERKKCEYFNKYNKKHLDNIQLKKENEQLRKRLMICEDKLKGLMK